jgi:hypothetical protein
MSHLGTFTPLHAKAAHIPVAQVTVPMRQVILAPSSAHFSSTGTVAQKFGAGRDRMRGPPAHCRSRHIQDNAAFTHTGCTQDDAMHDLYQSSEAFVDERVAFQLSLTVLSDVVISTLSFSSLAIYFSHKEQPITVHHNASAMSASKFQCVDLGDLPLEIAAEHEGCLRWKKGAMIQFVDSLLFITENINKSINLE